MTAAFYVVAVGVAAVVASWLATRFLGVRRSWVANGIAAVGGLALGVLLAWAIREGSTDYQAFGRTVVLLTFLCTMVVAVGWDLLARPGTLAKGEAAGLFVVPHPVSDTRRRLEVARRLRQIVRIAVDNGFGPHLGARHRAAVEGDDPVEVRLRRALEQGGGMFVKLGQMLSTRGDLLPPPVIDALSSLQSDVAPEDPTAMRELIEGELGAPVEQVFAEFDWTPLAAASIAQVHAATLHTGEKVVVKAQRPGVAELVRVDTEVVLRLAAAVEANTPLGAEFHPVDFAREFTGLVAEELDFRGEARNALAMAAQDLPGIRIPRVWEEYSTPRLLVQERFEGPLVSDTAALEALGVDRSALARHLLDAELDGMLVSGVFHADPHPGNVLVLPGPEVGLIDFGAVGRLDQLLEEALQHMVVAVVLRNAPMLREAVTEACEVSPEVDPDLLEKALARFLAQHVSDDASIDGGTVADLLEMLTTFGIRVPSELTTFGRALAILEGTLLTLAPDFQFADGIKDFGARWAQEHLGELEGPKDPQEALQEELIQMMPTLRRLPGRLDQVLDAARTGTLTMRVSRYANPEDREFVTAMVDRALLAGIGAVLAVVSVLLLMVDAGPTFAGGERILDVVAAIGLFAGAVLLLRVAARIVRDGSI